MATEKVNVLITGQDQVSPEIKKVSDSVNALDQDYKDLAKSAGAGFVAMDKKLSSLSTKAIDFGQKMTLGVTTPIIAAGGYAVKLASDMEETLNKVDVSFGDSAVAVKDWAKNSISSMGLAQESALNTAALFGDMGTGMGITQEAAGDMATELTQLSADLASFKNIRQDVAETALKSVYTGETESLKNLGIVMTQSNLEAFALSNGIQKNISDMTEAEKVQLRYAFVMDRTKNSQGDFARTLGGTANQSRMFTENIKELGRQLGEVILPVFNNMITSVNKALVGWQGMSDTTKKIIIGFAGVLAAIGPLSLAVGYLTKGYLLLKGAIAGVKAVTGLMTVANIKAVTGLFTLSGATAAATTATTVLGTALKVLLGPIGWVIAGVGLLFTAYKTNFLGMQDVVKTFGRASRGFMKGDMETKAKIVQTGVTGLLKIYIAFNKDMLANIVVAVKKAAMLFAQMWVSISGIFKEGVNKVLNYFSDLGARIYEIEWSEIPNKIGASIMNGFVKVGNNLIAAGTRIFDALKKALKGDFSGFDISDLLFSDDGTSKITQKLQEIGASDEMAAIEGFQKKLASGLSDVMGTKEFGFSNTTAAVQELGNAMDAIIPKMEEVNAASEATGGVAEVTNPKDLSEMVAQNTETQDQYFENLGSKTSQAISNNNQMTANHGANAVVQQEDMNKTSSTHGKMVTSIKEANNNLVDNIQKTVDKAVALYEKLRQTILQIKAITAPKDGPDSRSIQDVAKQFNVTDPTQGSFVSANPSYATARNFRDSSGRASSSTSNTTNQNNNVTFNISGNFRDENQAQEIMDMITQAIKSGAQFA